MKLQKQYDSSKNKHLIEGTHYVLHCHHYNTLLHKAITSTPFFDGTDFLFDICKKSFHDDLSSIVNKKNIPKNEIKKFANGFYKHLGFGEFNFNDLTESGGKVIGTHSHISTGYFNKWGKQNKPVDDFGRAYIAALWMLLSGKEKCKVKQLKCISCGDKYNEFMVEV